MPGQVRGLREIAGYCDCSFTAIEQIEQKAIRKLRVKIRRDPVLMEVLASGIGCDRPYDRLCDRPYDRRDRPCDRPCDRPAGRGLCLGRDPD